MKYKHYLLTRFNIRINFFDVKNPNDSPMLKILDEDYLEERFDIFEKYTLPSIKDQSNQNFKWIILFHKETPTKFLKRIEKLKKIYDFEDLYFSDIGNFSFLDYCAKYNEYYDFYITTRIDNDDMIDVDYIKRIQDYANKNLHECFVSFPHGEKLDLNFNKRVDTYFDDNHFISMIGSNEKIVLNFNHSKIKNANIDIVYFETDKPMWTEIIHNSNVSNEISERDIKNYYLKEDNVGNSEFNDDLSIYQLIALKNKLNREKKNYVDEKVSIGDYTYGKPIIKIYSGVKLKIGKFCCIEDQVTFLLGGEHRTDWISTYPFNVLVKNFNYIKGHPKIKGDINVGNDVWIGHGAKILSGVNIGDGAVIGANALVMEDIPNYAIVTGNPANIIGYRFEKDIIKRLEEIRWWDFKEDKLVKLIPFLLNNDVENFFKEVEMLDKS